MLKGIWVLLVLLAGISCKAKAPAKIFNIQSDVDVYSISVEELSWFRVRIPGNPTTGYSWFLVNEGAVNDKSSSINTLNLDQSKEGNYVADTNGDGREGVGGVFEFDFKSHEANDKFSTILVAYRRPWEPSPIQTVKILVHVTKKQN